MVSTVMVDPRVKRPGAGSGPPSTSCGPGCNKDVDADLRRHDGGRSPQVNTQGRWYKAQQMRWSRRGADPLLQVRCAVYNGTLGSGFGQRFRSANDPSPPMAIAA